MGARVLINGTWYKTIEAIANLRRQLGLNVLMAEQNFWQAIRIADRGYVLVHGQIVLSADDLQALQKNELVRKYYLGVGAGNEKRRNPERGSLFTPFFSDNRPVIR
jgi:ABC-type transporter Mla maintaining outer membrane lipid asymmetry ATPase subunit MlaF